MISKSSGFSLRRWFVVVILKLLYWLFTDTEEGGERPASCRILKPLLILFFFPLLLLLDPSPSPPFPALPTLSRTEHMRQATNYKLETSRDGRLRLLQPPTLARLKVQLTEPEMLPAAISGHGWSDAPSAASVRGLFFLYGVQGGTDHVPSKYNILLANTYRRLEAVELESAEQPDKGSCRLFPA